jgi:hypothetical protein
VVGVSPKYSTDSDTRTTELDPDSRHILAEWSDQPFVGVRKRHDTIEHRLVVEVHDGGSADILHEIRSDDTEKPPDEWEAVEWIEVREYGTRYQRTSGRGWWA